MSGAAPADAEAVVPPRRPSDSRSPTALPREAVEEAEEEERSAVAGTLARERESVGVGEKDFFALE